MNSGVLEKALDPCGGCGPLVVREQSVSCSWDRKGPVVCRRSPSATPTTTHTDAPRPVLCVFLRVCVTSFPHAHAHAHARIMSDPLLPRLVPALVAEFGARYPELAVHADMIQSVLANEERSFAKMIAQGGRMLNQHFDELALANKANKASGITR